MLPAILFFYIAYIKRDDLKVYWQNITSSLKVLDFKELTAFLEIGNNIKMEAKKAEERFYVTTQYGPDRWITDFDISYFVRN